MMLRKLSAALFLSGACVTNANPQDAITAIDIPTDKDYQRYRLDVAIPITKSFTERLTIFDRDGLCVGLIRTMEIDFKLPAPCDIMTMGAVEYGFKPRVRYNEKSDKPTSVIFQIVGALKYYPQIRAECSDKWRNIELRWPGPTVHVSELRDTVVDNDGLHCPRSYSYHAHKVSGLP